MPEETKISIDHPTGEEIGRAAPDAATRTGSNTATSRPASLLRLERRVAMYEGTLGLAVLPVLFRRLAMAIARRISADRDPRPPRDDAAGGSESRRWAEVGPGETGTFKMFLDPSAIGHGASQMALGTYDETFIDAIRPHSTLQGAVVWDVGAHIGYESLYFATLVGPAGRVVAFEPNPANVREWERNIAGDPKLAPRLSLHKVALSDSAGTAALRFSEDILSGRSSGSHLATVMPPEGQVSYATFGLLDVACARVDDLVESGEISPPAVIKIDVEGAEAEVLRGALRTLQRQKPLLLVEVHSVRAMHALDAILGEAGYIATVLESPEESASRCFLKAVYAG